jgi:hypothetical protein
MMDLDSINSLLDAVTEIPSFGNDKQDYSQLVPTTLDPVTPDRVAPLGTDIVKTTYKIIKDMGNYCLIETNATNFCNICKLSSFTTILGKNGTYCRKCSCLINP